MNKKQTSKKQTKGAERFFLNKNERELASMGWQVDPTDSHDGAYAAVTFRDCSRTITLDFDWYDGKRREERITKIDEIISSLQRFRRVLKATRMEKA